MKRLLKSLHILIKLCEVMLEFVHIDFLYIHTRYTLGEESAQRLLQ